MSLTRRIFCNYKHFLYKYPYRTQAIQIASILGVGDFLAQTFLRKKYERYDLIRTLRFMSAGLIIGPSVHLWYVILENIYGRSAKRRTVFFKVATDQLIFAPICLAAFLSYMKLMKGHTIDELKYSLKNEYPRLLRDNYSIWPAAQVINFSFISLKYRVLFLQSIGVLWNTYLAWRLHSDHSSDKTVDEN